MFSDRKMKPRVHGLAQSRANPMTSYQLRFQEFEIEFVGGLEKNKRPTMSSPVKSKEKENDEEEKKRVTEA